MDVSVAQLVEQLTLNQWVEGSSPSGYTEIRTIHKELSLFFLINLPKNNHSQCVFFHSTLKQPSSNLQARKQS